MKIENNIFKYDSDNWISYTEYTPERFKYTLVLCPPGERDENLLFDIISLLPKNVRIICVGYPSRGSSSISLENSSIYRISRIIYRFINKVLESEKIILVGFSFGTAVVTKVLQRRRNNKILFSVLINPGEFFSPIPTRIFKTIFTPATRNIHYAKSLKSLISKIAPLSLKSYDEARLSSLNSQWISTLDYRTNTYRTIKTPTVILHSTKDIIIDPESKKKIESIYINSKIVEYNQPHILNYGSLKLQESAKQISKEIQKYIATRL